MFTKADFTKAIADTIDKYPAIAALYRVGDPRILQNLEAQATMLAMLSSQIEVAMSEPFDKVRDATVLADAAMRGIIRKARPGKVLITLYNKSLATFSVSAGRIIIDSTGKTYRIDTPVSVAGSGTGTFYATQVKAEIVSHVVTNSTPFYAIEIPDSTDSSYLSGIEVSDIFGDYEYRERYVNTAVGEHVFHVETDDKQRIYVRFGHAGVVADQPGNGTEIELKISRSFGALSLAVNSPFSFEYILTPQESLVELVLDSVVDAGENPPDMATLRDLVKYPSVYDHNAVYLGEFNFLVRRTYSDTRFLSIWNESIEETVRGASVNNINTLFVACMSSGSTESSLTESSYLTPISPAQITTLTATQIGIKALIKAADDSYRVKFFTPVRSKITMTVTATISTAYNSSDVRQQIIDAIITEFGINSLAAKRGPTNPLYQKVYSLLREKIPALSSGNPDWQVSIPAYPGAFRPELWRYVDATSLTVTVTTANITSAGWS